jgi:acyl-CoA synthetase (AMP-forming)/AMP-acid ligase II
VHLAASAAQWPDRAAIIFGRVDPSAPTDVITYRELDERSRQVARLLHARGLGRGGSVAIFLENHPRYLEVAWAAQRTGLAYTTINSHLTVDEAAYIVNDCDATLVVSSAALTSVAAGLDASTCPKVETRLLVDAASMTSPPDGWESYEDAVAAHAPDPLEDECEGDFMLYSSGTTGRPKGIWRPLTFARMGEGPPGATPFMKALGVGEGSVFISPAPLYHSAPLAWSMGSHRLGATAVVTERFDAEMVLRLIQEHRISHAQFVPTHFIRMLKLPDGVREKYDIGSLQAAIHAAAPCPVDVKRQMIEWWGPIIHELYSATEGPGVTYITSPEWLEHPGSVGRAMFGEPHILDDDGHELPIGEVGTVWFGGGGVFEYHNDPNKTAESRNTAGYSTVGDVGYVDEDGYLYLTDRKAFMIISGGVNIYPQEAEDALITHPKVFDVAVFGVPNDEMGEEVKAVVQPVDWGDAGPELEAELLEYCRSRLAGYKCPRSIDFERELPRLDTGKLYKRVLADRYRNA